MNTLLEKLTLEKKPIITGNFNLNLIKYMQNIGVNQFLENFLSNNFIPQITLTARITEKIATLIDNIGLLHSSWLEKLGFLVHESLCSSKQLQENVVHLATFRGAQVHFNVYLVVHQIKYFMER